MKKIIIIMGIFLSLSTSFTNCKGNFKNKTEFLKQLIGKYHFHIGAIIGSENIVNIISQHENIKKLYSINAQEILYNTSIDDNFLDFAYVEGNYNPSKIDKIVNVCVKKIKRGGILIVKSDSNKKYVTDVLGDICDDENFKTITNKNILYVRKQHKLTFIIPCYNRAHTIKRAIDSIYQQNLDIPFEVVCTDDASTDKTKNILLEYEKKYKNFKALFHEKNKGASEARNTCLAHSDGDLIFNLDSDNFLEPNSVGQLIELLDSSGYEIAAFGEIRFFFNGNKKKVKKHQFKPKIINVDNAWKDAMLIGSGNYLFTRKICDSVGGYNGRISETAIFGFKKLARGARAAILSDKKNNFYWHSVVPNESKWLYYEKLGKNNEAKLKLLKEHPELFTDKSNSLINNYNLQKRKLPTDLKNGFFTLINKNALSHLFKAYWYEDNKMYGKAINEYLMAIEKGCSNEKIYKNIKKLEERLRQTYRTSF